MNMKKTFLLLLAFAAFIPVSCVKNILPENDRSIEGRWAHIVDGVYADYYLHFDLGKCYTYTSPSLHYFSDNTMWNCSPDDFLFTYSEYYAIKEGCLQVSATQDGYDAVNLGRVSVQDDILSVGDVDYTRLTCITSLPSPYEAVKTVTVAPSSMVVAQGEIKVLTATVTPSTAAGVHLVWKSDNPNVVLTDDFGRIRAVAPGIADIMAQAPNGVYGICTIIVKEK